MEKKLIVIQGPTASGKTALAIAVAKHFQTVILSADSRQFYKEMSIGTAKPNKEEQDGVKHYFIDSHSIHESVSAAQFEKVALLVLEEEFKNHSHIVLVGGSGLFISALCKGLDDIPNDEKLRDELDQIVTNKGLTVLLEELKDKDEEYYNIVDKANSHRVIRAIEAIRLSGKKYSILRNNSAKKRDFESIYFTLDLPREILYDRINQRVEKMIDMGLVEEVRSLLRFKELQTLNTVGYKEIFAFLNEELTLERAAELIKQNTRRYAKRQLTWFRKVEKANSLKTVNLPSQLNEILSYLSMNAKS